MFPIPMHYGPFHIFDALQWDGQGESQVSPMGDVAIQLGCITQVRALDRFGAGHPLQGLTQIEYMALAAGGTARWFYVKMPVEEVLKLIESQGSVGGIGSVNSVFNARGRMN